MARPNRLIKVGATEIKESAVLRQIADNLEAMERMYTQNMGLWQSLAQAGERNEGHSKPTDKESGHGVDSGWPRDVPDRNL